MKTVPEIEHLLKTELTDLLRNIPVDRQPQWGTMNVWQMIEHLSWPFKASNGTITMPLTTEAEKTDRIKQIGLMNDRPLQRNFNNPLLTDAFKAIRNSDIEAALAELQHEINAFMNHFEGKDPSHTETHNIFGPLTYPEWLQFHYKHVKHHLEQFGVTI